MSRVSEKTQQLVQQVMTYKKSGDCSILEQYSNDDFERAITEYARFSGGAEHQALTDAYGFIKSNRDSSANNKLTWK